MDDGALRFYLSVARRQWWLLLQAVIVVAGVAWFFASRQDDRPYVATSLMQVDATQVPGTPAAASVRLQAVAARIRSEAVLEVAASSLAGSTVQSIAASLAVVTDPGAGTISVSARAGSPSTAVEVANAVSGAFIKDQRLQASSALEAQLAQVNQQLSDLESSIASIGNDLERARAAGADTSVIDAKREAVTSQYQALFAVQQNTKTSMQQPNSGLQVLASATRATRQATASPLRKGLIGAAIGLLIGAILAGLREALDTRLRDRRRVEDESGLVVVGELPEDKRAFRRLRMPALDEPKGAFAEALRETVVRLRFASGGQTVHMMSVTSPQPGDGKTALAANLAISYAQAGLETIAVSADLRRPMLETLFGLPHRAGLGDLLMQSVAASGRARLDGPGGDLDLLMQSLGMSDRNKLDGPDGDLTNALLQTTIPGLRILPAGTAPANPAELLSSNAAKELFGRIRRLADVVIIDSPSTVVADSLLLGELADAVLLVVSINRTDRRRLAKAAEVLASSRSNVLGVVINREHLSRDSFGPPNREKARRSRQRRSLLSQAVASPFDPPVQVTLVDRT
jgi:Mrp family chromosome partitioning ATPase